MGWDGYGHGDGLKWGTSLVHISHTTGPNESADTQQAKSTKRIKFKQYISPSPVFVYLFIIHQATDQSVHLKSVEFLSFPHHCRFFCHLPRIFFHLAIGVLGCAHSSVFVKFCLTLPTFVSWTVLVAIKKCMYYYCRLLGQIHK
jgi:hypothetical protein